MSSLNLEELERQHDEQTADFERVRRELGVLASELGDGLVFDDEALAALDDLAQLDTVPAAPPPALTHVSCLKG